MVRPRALACLQTLQLFLHHSSQERFSLGYVRSLCALFEWLEITIMKHLTMIMTVTIMSVSSVQSVAPKKVAKGKAPIRERTTICEGSASPRSIYNPSTSCYQTIRRHGNSWP
ncbi:hypothetical protein F4604DRAFT_902218 [Suillus subluteus]|nr:hypothetical protein F4604DRAFT_902218 [Suillus subluteus]